MPINGCQIYAAESSIPNAGLGMFTAVPISNQSNVSSPEIVINTVDFYKHQELFRLFKKRLENSLDEMDWLSNRDENCDFWAEIGECDKNPKYMLDFCQRACSETYKAEEVFWVPENYEWNSRNTHAIYDGTEVLSLVPGLGMLANSHPGLVNLEMRPPIVDAAGLHRYHDPGAGAYSTYHGSTFVATWDIPAGMELFAPYGDSWFEDNKKLLGIIPLSTDYVDADKLLSDFVDFIEDKEESFAEALLSFIQEDLIIRSTLKIAIPSVLDDAKKAQKEGAAMHSVPNVIQSLEWLEQNGRCLDNIISQKSSIKQAGRGAFATRPISKGNVIAPAPMIHFQRSHTDMFTEDDEGGIEHLGKKQLILNYCFGHPDSSLLLFPYSPITNFINHNDDNSQVNAKIQWSTMSNHHEEWLEQSVEEVLSNSHSGLIMEFIATRDINEGEEIFIDYGGSWKDAWGNHLDNWTPINDAETYVPVELLNNKEQIMTLGEQETQPYPENALMICYAPLDLFQNTEDDADWYESDSLYRLIENSKECSILERYQSPDGNETLYNVCIIVKEEGTEFILNGVPRRAIEFVDRPYSANQHMIGTFRHEIGIPDEIFPNKWKDINICNNVK